MEGNTSMIEIHLYGKLRGYIKESQTIRNNVIRIAPGLDETIESLLARVGINTEEIYNIFLNSKLLSTRSSMAKWLGYQQVRSTPFDWDLKIPVKSGDRIGLFGSDMAALVV